MARQPVRNPIGDFFAARTSGQWVGFGVAVALLLLGYAYWDAIQDEPPPDDADWLAFEPCPVPEADNGQALLLELGKIIENKGETAWSPLTELEEGQSEDMPALRGYLRKIKPAMERMDELLAKPEFALTEFSVKEQSDASTATHLVLGALALRAWSRADRVGSVITLAADPQEKAETERRLRRERAPKVERAWQDVLNTLRLGRAIMRGQQPIGVYQSAGFGGSMLLEGVASHQLDLFTPDAATTRRRTDELAAFRTRDEDLRRSLRLTYRLFAPRLDTLIRNAYLTKPTAFTPIIYKPNTTRRLFYEQFPEAEANIGRFPSEMTFPVMRGIFTDPPLLLNRLGHQLSYGSLDQLVRANAEADAFLAVLRTGMALQGYANEHEGELPGRLEQLVPDYIDAIPADPMTGQPLHFDRKERQVWSVGQNLKDDGGRGRYKLHSDDIALKIRNPNAVITITPGPAPEEAE